VSTAGPDSNKLCGFAGRIARLLEAPAIEADEDAFSTLNFFAGAIDAFLLARHHDYVDRGTKASKIGPVQEITRNLEKGKLSVDGVWLAGFYFNSGLARRAGGDRRTPSIFGMRGGWRVFSLQGQNAGTTHRMQAPMPDRDPRKSLIR
jgi:hypothetical protein